MGSWYLSVVNAPPEEKDSPIVLSAAKQTRESAESGVRRKCTGLHGTGNFLISRFHILTTSLIVKYHTSLVAHVLWDLRLSEPLGDTGQNFSMVCTPLTLSHELARPVACDLIRGFLLFAIFRAVFRIKGHCTTRCEIPTSKYKLYVAAQGLGS